MNNKYIGGLIGLVLLVLAVSASGCTSSGDNSTSSMNASDVKAQAANITSTNLQRNAENMTGKPVKITGKVFSIQGDMFLLFTKQSYGTYMDDVVYVNVDGTIPSTLINDDIATIYAVVNGKKEYSTAVGGSNKVPEVTVKPENIIVKE